MKSPMTPQPQQRICIVDLCSDDDCPHHGEYEERGWDDSGLHPRYPYCYLKNKKLNWQVQDIPDWCPLESRPALSPRIDVSKCFDDIVYSSTPWKIYRQDAGMGEHDYAVFLDDVFYCRTEDSQTAMRIVNTMRRPSPSPSELAAAAHQAGIECGREEGAAQAREDVLDELCENIKEDFKEDFDGELMINYQDFLWNVQSLRTGGEPR